LRSISAFLIAFMQLELRPNNLVFLDPLRLASRDHADHSQPWRAHALRVVSACFVVVTLASIWTTLTAG
jgi:hypothetical protein